MYVAVKAVRGLESSSLAAQGLAHMTAATLRVDGVTAEFRLAASAGVGRVPCSSGTQSRNSERASYRLAPSHA